MRSVRMVGSVLWNIVVPLSVSFGVFGLVLFLYSQSGGVTVPSDRYDVLRDTLTIVLAVTAIVIAVLGLAAYRVLRLTLTESIHEEIDEKYLRLIARSQVAAGYIHWDHYKKTELSFLLEYAIQVTEEAHTHIRNSSDKGREDEKFESEAIGIINNWGYYLAEKAKACNQGIWEGETISEQEKALARSFADFLEQRLHKYPDFVNAYGDTINYIRANC